MRRSIRIALTGGPCGGKTEFIKTVRQIGLPAAPLPEVAPLVFKAGFDAHLKEFQHCVVRLQIAIENEFDNVFPGIHLCHRGTLDPLAYWLYRNWSRDDFFETIGTDIDEQFSRYDAVLHFESVANGAPEFYRSWPKAHRSELVEEARRIDSLCAEAWREHPRYVRIGNDAGGWNQKLQTASTILIDICSNKTQRSSHVPQQFT